MISIQNLSKSFDGLTFAVNNFSLKLHSGEICCLIGTSGCGKTTTLKMINQLIEPSSGDIIIDDTSYKDCSKIEWRRGIGYVIQKAGLLPHLNIKENIEILAKVLKVSKEKRDERVKFLMKMINLDYNQYAYKYPHELSGGQQQRVGIARALMQDPPLMLMDEPFGALDPITRNSLHNEFLDLNRKLSKTIILVTHDIQEAFKLADKIIVMHQGKIIQQGSQQQLEQQPVNSFVKNFIGGQCH